MEHGFAVPAEDNGRLRFATMDDLMSVFDLVNESYRVENGTEGYGFKKEGVSRYRSVSELQKELDDRNTVFLLRLDDSGATTGVASLYRAPQQRDRAYLGPIAVHSSAQGQGVGSFLISASEMMATQAGCAWMDLCFVNLRTDLESYYLKRGYEITGSSEFAATEVLSRPAKLIHMQKQLQPSKFSS
eukprot:GILK01013340.1.p1 GENE.GILK01013340.1~~GILK01013340.1.p1  ORF type:complete len:200 (-),score=30.59 GILK01013340.1:151-711(-)